MLCDNLHRGGDWERMDTRICTAESLCYPPETITALLIHYTSIHGLTWWFSGKESACQSRRHGFDPWVGKIPWRRKWQPALVFLTGDVPQTEEPGRL